MHCPAQAQSPRDDVEEGRVCEAGSYVRKICFIKWYEVTFYTLEAERIVEAYRAHEEQRVETGSMVDSIAWFLLDRDNGLPLTLTIEPLRVKVGFSRQKKAVCGMLERAGFPVDEEWNLTKQKEHQEDVKRYVRTIMGLTSEEHDELLRTMMKGDHFILNINVFDEASVVYQPCEKNRNAQKRQVRLSSSHVLRGILSTYLTNENCASSLENKLPDSLMEGILAACEDK